MISDLTEASPQFTLTCISTGGPATDVTWTRNSATVTEGTQTLLIDPVTAQYTHTLTASSGGVYRCTVANNKPSNDSACIVVDLFHFPSAQLDQSPVTILPLDSTTVRISWTSSDTFSTCFQYTSSCNASGLVITHYKTALQPGVGYLDITLDDEFNGYEHSFILHYVIDCEKVTVPIFQADFSFGMCINVCD